VAPVAPSVPEAPAAQATPPTTSPRSLAEAISNQAKGIPVGPTAPTKPEAPKIDPSQGAPPPAIATTDDEWMQHLRNKEEAKAVPHDEIGEWDFAKMKQQQRAMQQAGIIPPPPVAKVEKPKKRGLPFSRRGTEVTEQQPNDLGDAKNDVTTGDRSRITNEPATKSVQEVQEPVVAPFELPTEDAAPVMEVVSTPTIEYSDVKPPVAEPVTIPPQADVLTVEHAVAAPASSRTRFVVADDAETA
jgi:hypothetical protein